MTNDFSQKAIDEIESISRTNLGSHYDLHDQVRDLAQKIDRMVQVNLRLQENISRLGSEVAELVEELKLSIVPMQKPNEGDNFGLINLPKIPPSPLETQNNSGRQTSNLESLKVDKLINELINITKQNEEITSSLRMVETKLSREDKNKKLSSALRGIAYE